MLKDVLTNNLEVVFCGTAKGEASATKGYYYAGPGNKFYGILHKVGFTPHRLEPKDCYGVNQFKIGLTDLVHTEFGNDSDITEELYLCIMEYICSGDEMRYERYGESYSKQLFSNLLRSEHIPFNLFIPLRNDLDFAKIVFNKLLSNTIKDIFRIKIEFAPSPKEKYLNDRTSFDTYIEYTHMDGSSGILGIEVKYTEQGYPLKRKSTEEIQIKDKESKYWSTTKKSGLFKIGVDEKLIQDDYRQIWRNHILGESISQVDNTKHFTSITIYPEGNTHINEALAEYQGFLISQDRVLGITYEEYLSTLTEFSPSRRFRHWIDYLQKRYIVD